MGLLVRWVRFGSHGFLGSLGFARFAWARWVRWVRCSLGFAKGLLGFGADSLGSPSCASYRRA